MKKTLVLVAAIIALSTGATAQENIDNPFFKQGYRQTFKSGPTHRASRISPLRTAIVSAMGFTSVVGLA